MIQVSQCRDSIFGPLIASDDELTFEHLDVEGLAQELFAIGQSTTQECSTLVTERIHYVEEDGISHSGL